ncbi:prepilin peptidase [Neisseria animalis]|uniref:Prepilin leader peptidase/N-methyltransferase n=1 Tax=Neisseria animalis TaxID=492 RepID=A0A5P3MTU6_NEIAN|nr:A24 family peptidase [Neisseria animalis]QEY24191.1 prepilin peptidase [Neisseria animalis]ROW32199.1 prepilin peptidase [Neisseria animalis]VEE06481.1 protein PilD [Neisseria animalis]
MWTFDIYTPFIVPAAALLGLLFGSFLNVVIHRIPIMMERDWTLFAKEHLGLKPSAKEQQPFNLMKPDSHCPECGEKIKARHNIPVISYLLLGGKCSLCRTHISLRYPLVELLTAAAFAVVAWQYGASWITLGGWVFTAFLIALAFIDADTHYLPDSLTLPLVWLGLLFNFADGMVALQSAVLGAVCGYACLWLLCAAYRLLTGQTGMGNGDFKLLAALGAWLGVGVLPVLVFAASLIGIMGAVLTKTAKGQAFAFGPSLALAGWIIFIAYEPLQQLTDWWLNASGL